MYEYNAKVLNVVDGDTFDLQVDLGFKIFHQVRVRLLGVDTPEKRGSVEKEYGLICTQYATKKFLNKEVVIKSKKIDTDVNTDSFGRYLVELRLKDDNQWVSDLYTQLGINKYASNYSEENVKKLKES